MFHLSKRPSPFSDRHKGLKISVTLFFVVISGIYYNLTSPRLMPGSQNIGGVRSASAGDDVCVYNVKIFYQNGMYYMKNRKREIEIRNLPNALPSNLPGEYIIKGYLSEKGYVKVEKIKRQNPRLYKLIVSGATAFCIGVLFLFYFKPQKGYIIGRRLNRDA